MNALVNTPANCPPFPVNPAVGQRYGQWMWNGSMWVCAPVGGQNLVTTVFTANGTYMPSPGLVTVKVRCVGGGGGSGSAGPVPSLQYLLGGGGGGSGGYSEKTLDASLVLGGVIVTIGAGGLPGGQGATAGAIINGTGGNGTATSFGALCVANGGHGGVGNNANQLGGGVSQNGYGGQGAVPGVGDIAFPGGDGGNGTYSYMNPSQTGGAFPAGRGGAVMGTGLNAFAGWAGQYANGYGGYPNTGQGATGAFISEAGGGPLEGATGGSGICIVDEYCWIDANPPATCQPMPPAARVPISGCGPGWGDFDGCGSGWGPPGAMPVGHP